MKKETKINKIFSKLIRNELTEMEFWSWVASWKDPDGICKEAEEWSIDLKVETLKKYGKLKNTGGKL